MTEKRERIRSLIKGFVARHANVDESSLEPFGDSHNFLERGDLDSVGFVNLLLFLSEETDQELDFSDIDPVRLGTVGELISLYEYGAQPRHEA